MLKAARCTHITLSDNRDYPIGADGYDSFSEDVEAATEHIARAGFRPRTDDCAVQIAVSRLGETPDMVAKLVARLSASIGSVIPVPYQPSLHEMGVDDPWETNGKLFPLAEQNGSSFMDYMRLLGLCAIVNAKHRSRTFDFFGSSLVAQSVRRSFAERAWDPDMLPSLEEKPGLAPLRMIGA